MKLWKRLVKGLGIMIMLLLTATSLGHTQNLRPIRSEEVAHTSPVEREVYRIVDTIKTTKDEGWATSLEVSLITCIKLRKYNMTAQLLVVDNHYVFITDRFFVDPVPDCEALMLNIDVYIAPLETVNEYYRNAVPIYDKKEQELVDRIISAHTSPLKIIQCATCGKSMEVPLNSPERRDCGVCIISFLEKGDFEFPNIWHIEINEMLRDARVQNNHNNNIKSSP